MAHVTGGGLIDNVPRMLPPELAAEIDPETWTAPPIFAFLIGAGGVPRREQYRAFNMGIGFVLAVAPDDLADVLAAIPMAIAIGRVVPHDDSRPRVRLGPTIDG